MPGAASGRAISHGINRVEHLAEGVTLYLGDCREILPTLGRVDAVVTDAPYGIGMAANPVRQRFAKSDWDAAPPDQNTFDLIRAKSDEQIIWGGNYFALPPSQGFLVWDKKQPQNFSLAMCEMAWCSRQQPARIWRQSALSYKRVHPTEKPVPLMKWCIQTLSRGDTVLDPFMGSGTTGVAAIKLGRNFIGIEKEPKYFDIACRRISNALKQPDLFIDFVVPPPKPATQEALEL